jgi:hypothetical protein
VRPVIGPTRVRCVVALPGWQPLSRSTMSSRAARPRSSTRIVSVRVPLAAIASARAAGARSGSSTTEDDARLGGAEVVLISVPALADLLGDLRERSCVPAADFLCDSIVLWVGRWRS